MLDVKPILTIDNFAHLAFGNSKPFSNGSLWFWVFCIFISDLIDHLTGKLAVVIIFTRSSMRHSLFNHVIGIILKRSKEKVFRIYARCLVLNRTVMEHAHSNWNWTPKQNPRCSVGAYELPERGTPSNQAIPQFVYARRPQPAGFSFTHLRPEPFFKSWGKSLRRQILRSNFNLHSVSQLIVCHALGYSNSARALLFKPNLCQCKAI